MKGSVKSKAVELQGQTLKIDQRKTGSPTTRDTRPFYKVGRSVKVEKIIRAHRQTGIVV